MTLAIPLMTYSGIGQNCSRVTTHVFVTTNIGHPNDS